MDYLLLIVGFGLLVLGGEWLLKSSIAISQRLNVSKVVIGVTVVSFATSAPELIVSIKAAAVGSPDISLGNVVGSNIANLGLVLGLTCILTTLSVNSDFYRLNWPMMVFISLLFYLFLYTGYEITRFEGFILLMLLFLFIWLLLKKAEKSKIDIEEVETIRMRWIMISLYLVLGGTLLWSGATLLVSSSMNIAQSLGVSEKIISVSMVAVGTSIPELAASIIAALKNEKSISLGNLVGSNIFNICSVIGITSIISPIASFDRSILGLDFYLMLAYAFILLPLVFIKPRSIFDKKEGFVLLGGYVVYILVLFN